MQSAPPLGGSTAWSDFRPSLVDQHRSPRATSRTNSAPTRSSAHVSEASDPVVAEPAEDERPEAVRVAERDQPALRERDARERAVELAHRVRDRLLERRVVVRDQRGDHSLSEVESSADPLVPASSSRSSAALTRLPLCPSATVRARPWCTSGCAFAQCVEPVVE